MIIREYMPSDCESMARLFYDTVHTINAEHYTKEQLDVWATGNIDMKAWNCSFLEHDTLIAEIDGVIVGFSDMDKNGYLDRLYVHKDYQRKGIAAELINKLEQRAGEAGVFSFETYASITARPFFEKQGYTVVAENKAIRGGIELINYKMVKRKKVILLNGPSSSGKSTLAKSLQKLIKGKKNEEYGIISIDDFLKMSADDTIYENDVFEVSSDLCDDAVGMLDTYQGVIIDHVITSERIYNQLIDRLRNYGVYLIHVDCPISELKRREKERKDRCTGSAGASYEYLFPKDGYDLTVDTYQSSAEECSLKIIDILSDV